ncbi:MAG: DEAD/DEAH box helicase [Limisphaerales bacterium]
MTPKLFSELGLSPEILKGIDKLGFEQAAPIQAAAIPILMSGKDVVGQSQTGSGKTAAFAIPAIEKTDPQVRAVQVLILCPTRELAVQVCEEVHKLAFFKRGIHALPIYGGQSYDRQLMGLRQGAQIIIGTPGRVMDHMERGTLRLDALKMLILDEADVMLNMGFRDDIEHILKSTPPERQTVFFSATMPRPIRDLIERHSKSPENVRVEQAAMTVPTVEQIYFEVDRRWKIEVLTRLIDVHDLNLGIVFCNTKRMVDELVEHLNTQGYSAEGLHGDMNQAQRDRVMNKFRKSGLEFLVATDVAARGIDVDDIQAVFNYDLPYDVEDYVHRIGRTGRAGRSGMAFSFVAGRELFQIRNIERFTRMRIQRGRVPSVEEVDEARANVLIGKVRTTLQVGKFHRQDHAVERLLEEGFDSTDIISAMLHLLEGGSPGEPDKVEKATAITRPVPGVPVRPVAIAPGASASPPPSAAPKQPLRAPVKPAAPARDALPRVLPAPRHEAKPVVPAPARIAPPADAPAVADQLVAPAKKPAPKPEAPPVTEAAHIADSQPAALPPAIGDDRSVGEATQPPAAVFAEPATATPEPAAPTANPSDEPSVVPSPAPSAHSTEHQPESAEDAELKLPSTAADLRKLINQPRKPGPPKKSLRTELDRPAARQPVRRDYDQYEDQPGERPQRDDSGPRSIAPGYPARRPASRATPAEMTRLWMSVGEQHGVAPGDVVGCILGETGLPSGTVGVVDIRERHTFVDVAADSAHAIISKLNRTAIRGQRLKVKLA